MDLACALAVVLGHAQHEAMLMAQRSGKSFTTCLMEVSGAGVDVFFVVSGFVMVYASRKLFEMPGAQAEFLKRRIIRIVPLYWMVTAFFAAVALLAPKMLSSDAPTIAEIVKSLLFIPYYHAGDAYMQPVYRLGWTLNYELFFYAVFSCLLFLPRQRALNLLTALFLALTAVSALLSSPNTLLSFWGHPIILEFIAGAWIASLHIDGLRIDRSVRFILLLGSLIAIYIGGLVMIDDHEPMRALFWGLPAAGIIAGCALCEERKTPGPIAMAMVRLGDASYALYLLHPIVIRVLRKVWDFAGLSSALNGWLFVAACAGISIVLALLVFRFVESPLTRMLQGRYARRSTQTIQPATA